MVNGRLRKRSGAAACGLLLDRLVGEPPAQVHPVAAFGRVMTRIERMLYDSSRRAGAGYTATGMVIGYAAGSALPPAVVVGCVVAGRALRREATGVRNALASGDLERARELVPALVGRDPSELDHAGLAAAVIESLAENTMDAVVAPVWWALVAGPAAAGAYRAVNTMDAMVGHQSKRYARFGWASARLDDVANYVPARLTALLVALVCPRGARGVRRAVYEQAPAHPSPNAGVAEAAFAAALGVELGGPLRYGDRCEERPRLGWGARPTFADIDEALAIHSRIEIALLALLALTFLVTRSR